MRRVLVSHEHPHGTGAVVRSGRQVWLADQIQRGGATGIDDHCPTCIGLWPAATLVGGLLPAGAVAARVTDRLGQRHDARVGGGAWIALLDQPADASLAVCYTDTADRIVRPALPRTWPRQIVEDAAEACPACDGTAWEHITADDESRGSYGSAGRWSPTPFVACARCGHEDSGGVWFGFADDERSPEQIERDIAASEEIHRREQRDVLAAVDFALYAVEGVAVTISGWGGRARMAESVTLCHGDGGPRTISVETDSDPFDMHGDAAEAQDRLAQLIGEPLEDWPQRSEPGRTVWLRHHERRQERAAAGARHDVRAIRVDGVAVAFAVADAGDRWAAVATLDGLRLAVSARGHSIDDVHLRALSDPLHAHPDAGARPHGDRYRPLRDQR